MISPEFAARANSFNGVNFNQARVLVNEEISRGNTYVPEFLNFTGLRGSRNVQSSSQGQNYPIQNYQNSAPYLNPARTNQSNVFVNTNASNTSYPHQVPQNNFQSNVYQYNSGPQSSTVNQFNHAGTPSAAYSTVYQDNNY